MNALAIEQSTRPPPAAARPEGGAAPFAPIADLALGLAPATGAFVALRRSHWRIVSRTGQLPDDHPLLVSLARLEASTTPQIFEIFAGVRLHAVAHSSGIADSSVAVGIVFAEPAPLPPLRLPPR